MHRSSFWTKIVSIIAIWAAIQVFFWLLGVDSVAAATLSEYVQDKIYVYNSILNGLYLLIWPALALAGFALDNSMVYGSLFGLDAPLFLIWNIIKNIANFILWFMVLFEILKNFFTTGEQGKKAFDVIKKALIAGVMIQASWFLMGAIIDISTIATYSIGGMPIAILWWEDNQCKALGEIKTLPIGTKIDFTASNANNNIDNGFQYYYYINKPWSTPDKTYFSPCEIYDSRWVIGPKFWGEHGGIDYVKNYCILPWNQFAYFGADPGNLLATSNIPWLTNSAVSNYIEYKANLEQIKGYATWWLSDPMQRSVWLTGQLIFDARSWAKSEATSLTPGTYLLNGTWTAFVNTFGQAPMLKDIINKAEWFVGVLITLYKSILNFVSFDTWSSSTDTFILFLETLLKVGFGIALLIPLILLSIALVIRVWYIWMFIALSPIIALKIAFDDNDTMKWIWSSIPIIKEKLSDILRIIFAPVIITFAVSFCLVFMTALITSINNQPSDNPSQCLGDNLSVFESMNVDVKNSTYGKNKTYQIAGIAELQQSAFWSDITGPQRDIFGWVLINLFGVAIIWLLLMTVIDSVFKWTPIGDLNLGSKALKMMSQIPIIPIPTKGGGWTWVWAGTLASVAQQQVTNMSSSITRKQENALRGIEDTDKGWWETSSSSTTASTTNTTIQTINDLKPEDRSTVIGTAATAWLGAAVYNIDNMPATIKEKPAIDVSKAIVVNPTAYEEYKAKVNTFDDEKKQKIWNEDAAWVKTSISKFNQDEFKTILERNDDLGKRLAPQALGPQPEKSRITFAWDEQVLTFKLGTDGTWTYEFTKATDADKTLPEYAPLMDKTPAITERDKKTTGDLRK